MVDENSHIVDFFGTTRREIKIIVNLQGIVPHLDTDFGQLFGVNDMPGFNRDDFVFGYILERDDPATTERIVTNFYPG
jgi:hypothetical protein